MKKNNKNSVLQSIDPYLNFIFILNRLIGLIFKELMIISLLGLDDYKIEII
jgi:hypothetical protein